MSVQIYGTLGPPCADAATLARMIDAGMTGIRLNLSHTTLREAKPYLDAVRAAVQKRIAARCRENGTPFMVVTQMLASMEHSRVPTRAEMSDIFNAVLDGAASVMVTGETAAGEYPADVIRYLALAAHAAETFLKENGI